MVKIDVHEINLRTSRDHLGVIEHALELGALPLVEGGRCEALSSSPFKESFMSNMTPETPKMKKMFLENEP